MNNKFFCSGNFIRFRSWCSVFALFPIFLAAEMSGCATHEKIPDHETMCEASASSVVSSYSSYFHGFGIDVFGVIPFPTIIEHQVRVSGIDNVPVGAVKSFPAVKICEGRHTLTLDYKEDKSVQWSGFFGGTLFTEKADLAVSFVAVRGHQYKAGVYLSDSRCWVWVEDATTGTVVSGLKPTYL